MFKIVVHQRQGVILFNQVGQVFEVDFLGEPFEVLLRVLFCVRRPKVLLVELRCPFGPLDAP